ncbi:MAG: response regulator [Candidatus Magnetoovum sp. WYHC-5]|nr:response regulator [Candidatus Magnetoovum sp. WYHC-5]
MVNVEEIRRLAECGSKMKVLYVEDEKVLREATRRLLFRFFKVVDTAENGEEGLIQYETGEYDIIISDICMPVLNGVDMVKKIKAKNEKQAVIVVSAHDDSHYLIDLINIGIDSFLLKPIKEQYLMSVLYKISSEIMYKQEVEKRKKVEQLLLQKSRIIAMGELITSIAHNWRQPLNQVGLIIQDLEEAYKFDELDENYLSESVSSTLSIISSMSSTITQFSNYFQPESTMMEFDIGQSLKKTLELFCKSLEHLNIECILNIHDDIKIIGYELEINQVFLHILNNAKDAIVEKQMSGFDPKDKKGIICEDVYKFEDMCIVLITDNGGNISEEILGRIFDPYFTTKEQGKGIGMGLYVSKIIIEEHMGGLLYAENIGNGVMFTIELPLALKKIQKEQMPLS